MWTRQGDWDEVKSRRDFADDDVVSEGLESSAAVFCRHLEAEQAELAGPPEKSAVHAASLLPFPEDVAPPRWRRRR